MQEHKIFMINEKGIITHRNKNIITSYSNLNELQDLVFPYVKGNNTYFANPNFFKPKIQTDNIKDLFK